MNEPNRIVVRAPNWIGDQVMALGFYRALRAHYPLAQITLIGPRLVLEVPLPRLWNQTRELSPDERRANWRGLGSLVRYLKSEHFDLAISLPSSWSATLPFFLAHIPHRVGFAQGGTQLLLTAPRSWQGNRRGLPKRVLYEELAGFLGAPSAGSEIPVAPTAREKLIVLAPGASIALRVWPYFKELAQALQEKYPSYRLAVVGAASDLLQISWLNPTDFPRIENLVGGTTLLELVAVFQRASLVIANDSGPAHLAATLAHAPTLVLMGPGDPKYITPEGPQVEVARLLDLPCSPCESAQCRAPFGYQACLKKLTPDDILGLLTGREGGLRLSE